MAVCVNTDKGIQYLERLWVEGKEKRLQGAAVEPQEERGEQVAPNARLEDVETRLAQVVQALDDQRKAMDRVLMTLGVLVCIAVVFMIGNTIYGRFAKKWSLPKRESFVRIPVQVGDKAVYLGMEVTSIEVPPELMAIQVAMAKEHAAMLQQQEELLKQQAAKAEKRLPWWKRLFGGGKPKDKTPQAEKGEE